MTGRFQLCWYAESNLEQRIETDQLLIIVVPNPLIGKKQ